MNPMLSQVVTDTLGSNLAKLVAAIDLCVEQKFIIPALMLIYAGIDSVGALEKRQGEGVKESFVRWTESYLLKATELPCKAIDLYAARCGILHTMAAESRFSSSKSTRASEGAR